MQNKALDNRKKIIDHIMGHYGITRLWVWGSLENDNFKEYSDIDLGIEGINGKTFSRLTEEVMDIAFFPLDIHRLEETAPIHRQQIMSKGRVIYEKNS